MLCIQCTEHFHQHPVDMQRPLPMFHQAPTLLQACNCLASEVFLRKALPEHHPSTAQLCLVTDVLEQEGEFQGLVTLFVDVIAMGRKVELSSETADGEDWLDPAHKPLPLHLCVLLSSLLQRHMA